jgi:16S rRNA processing protein RimM
LSRDRRWDDMALVGVVARAHGNRGEVIVNLETDFAEERFRAGEMVFVETREGGGARRIVRARMHQGRPVIALEGVDTMSDAEALAGLELRVPDDQLTPLPDGAFYRHDLVGCRVVTTDGAAVGPVTAVEGTMEMSRLVVAGPRGEVLIPFVERICVRVDPAAREIVIAPPDGLLELNA